MGGMASSVRKPSIDAIRLLTYGNEVDFHAAAKNVKRQRHPGDRYIYSGASSLVVGAVVDVDINDVIILYNPFNSLPRE
jgi:hypothetical protein